MRTVSGTNNKILEIDLTSKKFIETNVSEEDRKNYLGGKGLALKLLYDRLTPGVDPLGADNIFIVTTGVLIGTGAPNSARFSAVSKSPLTGIITHSSCGGPFGNALKTSGWDGMILKGKSVSPIFLLIDSQGVKFTDAENFSEKTTSETETHLSYFGNGSLAIGPAGENLVRFANISSGERYLGRGGLGAVLGSKNVKGITARGGECKIVPKDPETFKKYSSRGFKYIKQNYYIEKKYKMYGTLNHLSSNNNAQILPVRNFKESSSPEAEKISGEYIKETRNPGYRSCRNCSILCGHEGVFNEKLTSVPEYETTCLLGSNIGVFDIDKISEWNDICGELGLDTISAGGTLAYVMEAAEKGLLDSPLRFGKPEHIAKTLEDIAFMRGFGSEIAMGSRKLSERYGGEEFCMSVKGLELSAYDPRGSVGMGLNYAVANRGGCHLSSTIFGLEITMGLLDSESTINKATYVEFMENAIAAINSLHTCLFTIYPFILESLFLRYIPVFVLKPVLRYFPFIAKLFFDFSTYSGLFSSITGIKISGRDFLKSGKRTHILERYMNTREGVDSNGDKLPYRILNENSRKPGLNPFPLNKMLKKYYRIRKYDTNGIPMRSSLKRLGIEADGKQNRT